MPTDEQSNLDQLLSLLDWQPTDSPFRQGAQIADDPLSYIMAMREKFPDDKELANLDHEVFMEDRSVGEGLVLPPVYYLVKKLLQSTPELEEFGREFTAGGLLDQPILDETTSPASLDQMMHGIYGALKDKPAL